jgi:hypothetical protein
MTKPPLADVPIRSADDLTRRWATVLDPPVFGAHSLVLAWLDADGRMLPILMPVDDPPVDPDVQLLEGLRRVHIGVAATHLPDGGHFAIALCRPGGPEVTEADAAWAHAFREALDGMPLPFWSLHLAAGGRVSEIAAEPERICPAEVTRCGDA